MYLCVTHDLTSNTEQEKGDEEEDADDEFYKNVFKDDIQNIEFSTAKTCFFKGRPQIKKKRKFILKFEFSLDFTGSNIW